MNTATFHTRLGVLGLSVRRFAAVTGVQYETARHWGVVRHGHPQDFPRWVPLMLEMDGPNGITETARQDSALATPESRRGKVLSWQAIIAGQQRRSS